MRGIGKTTKMLEEALAMKEVACRELPVLIYGNTQSHAYQLRDDFARLCRQSGIQDIKGNSSRGLVLVLEGEAEYQFRSFQEPDSPRGVNYADILVDHYALQECFL